MEVLSQRMTSKLAEPLYGRSKKIYVFENGDRYSKCFPLVINPKVLKTWRNVLQNLTERMTPSFGTIENLVHLKTMEKIKCFEELEVDEKYVALGPNGQFVSMNKKYFLEETEKRGLTVIFVVPNGGSSQEARKFVFSIQDLANWTQTLFHIGKALDIDGLMSLLTIFGDTVEESCQLQHGFLYVAVPYNQEFIPCDYEKMFNEWNSPNAFKLKIFPANHKSMVKFKLDKHQIILKLNESAVEENVVLPDTNVTLFKDAMSNKTNTLRGMPYATPRDKGTKKELHSGKCETPCTEGLICCPVCSCIIKIPDPRKKKKGSKRSTDPEDSLARSPLTHIIRSKSMESSDSDIQPSTENAVHQEAPCPKPVDSLDSISRAKIPNQEQTKGVKDKTDCAKCKCGDSKESTGCKGIETSYHHRDLDLGEVGFVAPKTTGEPSAPVALCSDTSANYRKHGTPSQISERAHENSELNKTPSFRQSADQMCEHDCEYFRNTGIQYPHCRCDELDLDNILQSTIVGHFDREKGTDEGIESSKALSNESSKDSTDSCLKKANQTKFKEMQKADSGSGTGRIHSPTKSEIKKPKGERSKLTGSSSQQDKKTKTVSPKGADKEKKPDKSCKKSISIDALETEDVAKKQLDHKTKKCAKKKKVQSHKTTECSANIDTYKLSDECEAMKFSERNVGAPPCQTKQSKTTNKCASIKRLDPVSEISSKTTNTTFHGSEEASVKLESGCPIIYEVPSSCEVKEELLQQLIHIAVRIEDQYGRSESPTQSAILPQSSRSCDAGEKALKNEDLSSCSGGQDGEEHVKQLTKTPASKPNPPGSCSTGEENVEEDVEEIVEKFVEESVEDDKACSGCLSVICQCEGRFGEFCDCDISNEPAKYILICDSNCDFLRRTGSSCPVCECDSCNEEDDLENREVRKTCERSVEVDLKEVIAVDQDTQVGESCVCVKHEPHSVEVCMRHVSYDDCFEEILSDISEDSLESCGVIKAVKEETKLVKKARCLSIEDVSKPSKDKKCRPKKSCSFLPNELQRIRIKNKMDVNFYGTSGAKHHYSKTKKYKTCAGSNFTFISDPSTGESDRI
nr:unnamed protein product [Callosobruchus chinensis]